MQGRLAFTSYGGAAGPPGPAGPAGPAGPPGPAGGTITLVNGNAGTLAPGTAVYASAAGIVNKAQANAAATAIVIGLASAAILTTAPGVIAAAGPLTLTTAQWDAVTGDVGGLVVNAQYWASATVAGNLKRDPAPNAAGNFDVLIGTALSPTTLDITIGAPIGPL